jgi:PPOX class probable F420-dependent enzyme
MAVTLDLQSRRGRHAESRLERDTIAWLTTVRPTGQPDTVPVWFLWRDNAILIYSQPHARKLKNLGQNANVSVVLDDTDGGGDVVRIEGTAKVASDHPGRQRRARLRREVQQADPPLVRHPRGVCAGLHSSPHRYADQDPCLIPRTARPRSGRGRSPSRPSCSILATG